MSLRRSLLTGAVALTVTCSKGEGVREPTREELTEQMKELWATAQDGSRVSALIHYRVDGCDEVGGAADCYYYIITRYPTDRPDTSPQVRFPSRARADGACLKLRFYDRHGFSLFRGYGGNVLSPGWNDVPDETEFKDGTWRWKGRFSKGSLPLRAFRDSVVMTAEAVPDCRD